MYDIYVLFQGNLYTKIEGVTGETIEDVAFYDGNNYRDIFTVPGVSSTGANVYDPSFDAVQVTPSSNYLMKSTDSAMTNVFAPAPGNSASDEVMHHPPRFEQKTRSRYKWACADGGTRWAWADEIVSVSKSTFGFAGSSLPA